MTKAVVVLAVSKKDGLEFGVGLTHKLALKDAYNNLKGLGLVSGNLEDFKNSDYYKNLDFIEITINLDDYKLC